MIRIHPTPTPGSKTQPHRNQHVVEFAGSDCVLMHEDVVFGWLVATLGTDKGFEAVSRLRAGNIVELTVQCVE